MSGQLFHLLNDVDISHDAHYNPLAKKYSPRHLVTPATFAVTWPDGMPCGLVEIYLIYRFRHGATVREYGGSLRPTVSHLSHLIRYCYCQTIKRDFWELEDEDIYQLVVLLMEEMKPNAPLVRARDNNTVIAIIASIVAFLRWLQSDMLVGATLIGVGPAYRIPLVERKTYDSRNRKYTVSLVYPRLPPKETKEPKRPMSRAKRDLLWQGVGKLSNSVLVLPPWARHRDEDVLLISYLKARRELLLELLEATGARPGELARLTVSENEDCYKTQELVLVTLKRKRPIKRKIKLQPGVAMRLTVFIRKYRAALLDAIRLSGRQVQPKDRVFLGNSGLPMSEGVMGSEFRRISLAAGLSGYQSCMSMFRHRFITKQVAIHLGIFLSDHNKTKEMMTESDYRTILKKVATITGHGNENSLLHYIDLAWEELGTGDQIDKAIAIDALIEISTAQIISLNGVLQTKNKKFQNKFISATIELLDNLRKEIHTVLNG